MYMYSYSYSYEFTSKYSYSQNIILKSSTLGAEESASYHEHVDAGVERIAHFSKLQVWV